MALTLLPLLHSHHTGHSVQAAPPPTDSSDDDTHADTQAEMLRPDCACCAAHKAIAMIWPPSESQTH